MKSFHGATVRRTIGAAPYQRIKRFGAQHGCTLFATLLAGFKVLLHRLTGQNDVVVGIPAAGQSLIEAESLVGHCVNFLPLRTSFEGDPPSATLLTGVRGTLLGRLRPPKLHLREPRPETRAAARPEPAPSRGSAIQPGGRGGRPGLLRADGAGRSLPQRFVNFDLFLNVVESDDGLVLDCDYNRGLFDPTTVERWLRHLETLLEGLVADPRQAVSGAAAARRCRGASPDGGMERHAGGLSRDKCVHDLMGEQAARTPQAVAAVCGDRRLTYAELDGAANRLAHYLRKRGWRGRSGGGLPRPFAGHAPRRAGRPQGRGGLRAAGPRVPAGTSRP